jgi:tetratricopeptide (TPR) repeat protein
VVLLLAGVLQLIPQVRARAPRFHRWNGRVYLLSAFTLSIAGLYMLFRGSFGSTTQHLGLTLNAVLIWVCAAMALRYALARDFATHRRWALRLFVVACGVFFTRTGVMLASALNGGPFGFDAKTFQGPFPDFMAFASYLLPLAVVELYLRAQDRPGKRRRYAMAGGLALLALATVGGVGAAGAVSWLPEIKTAYDGRKSIADTLYGTLTAAGADAAARQYRGLKADSPAGYNFDETELNNLGYELIRVGRYEDAIRIFQLNVEAYPRSGNVYDNLGEAYMDAGDKAQAIASYRKSLELDPKNQNAVLTLKQLSGG